MFNLNKKVRAEVISAFENELKDVTEAETHNLFGSFITAILGMAYFKQLLLQTYIKFIATGLSHFN